MREGWRGAIQEKIAAGVDTAIQSELWQHRVKNFNELVKQRGFVGAVNAYVERFGGSVTSHCSKETLDVLSGKEPVIVIADHPEHRSGQPSIIAALPEKRDASVMVAEDIARLFGDGPASKHFLPLHGTHQKERGDTAQMRLMKLVHSPVSEAEARRNNRRTMSDAVKRVQKGETLVLMPDGNISTGENNWFPGIGTLIKRVPDAKIVMARAEGTSRMDMLKLLPGIRARKPFHADVHFSTPIPAQQFIEMTQGTGSGKEQRDAITARVQHIYREWATGSHI